MISNYLFSFSCYFFLISYYLLLFPVVSSYFLLFSFYFRLFPVTTADDVLLGGTSGASPEAGAHAPRGGGPDDSARH